MKKKICSVILLLCFILSCFSSFKYIKIYGAEAVEAFSYDKDTWGFSANTLIDGEKPYLTSALNKKLMAGKSQNELERIDDYLSKPLEDISYGLALLEVLHYNNFWNVSDISNTASSLHEVHSPSRKDVLVGFINYCNILQFTDDIRMLDENAFAEGNNVAIKNAVAMVEGGKPALIRLYKSSSDMAVTAVIYGCEKGLWRYNGIKYDNRILLANTDNTSFSDDSCIYYSSISENWIIPDMSMSDSTGAVIGAVINDIDILSKNSYDIEKLPKMMIERIFTSPGALDIPISLCESGIPECMGISLDLDLSPAAQEILRPSYESNSYDIGEALPANLCVSTVNDNDFIIMSIVTPMASGGMICEENTPIISYIMDCADEFAVKAAAEKYNLPLCHDDEHGDYYAFPLYFGTQGTRSYYLNIQSKDEFPIVMNSEICVVIKSNETTTSSVTTETSLTSLSSVSTENTTSESTFVSSSATIEQTEPTIISSSALMTTSTVFGSTDSSTKFQSVTETIPETTRITYDSSDITTSVPAIISSTDTVSKITRDTTIASTTVTTLTTTFTTFTTSTTSTTKQQFEWGKDNWQYSHDLLVPEYMADGYRVTNSHMDNLVANLSPMERVRIKNIMEREWLGAEYGMAVTEILAKSEIFSIPMWDPRYKALYELDLSDERNLSLISYYQLLQEVDSVQQEIAWTSTFLSKKYVLSQLISSSAASSKGGDMTLVCFFSKDYAHAAIAYDVEYGLWYLGETSYDGRIIISDPYLDNSSNESCLYFNSSTFEWKIPSLHMDSDDTFIGLCSNSTALINDGGYFMGTSSYSYQHSYIPILEVPVNTGDFIISPIGSLESNVMESSEFNWFSTVASIITHRRAGLDPDADGFEIYPVSKSGIDYQISFEKCLLSVMADNAESVILSADGSIDLMAIDGEFKISMTAESALPWSSISFWGNADDRIKAEYVENGIMLTGNHLEGINVTADSFVCTMNALISGGVYTKAFIYAKDNGTIGIRVDADGDGECETELEDQYSEKLICGDLNVDGIVSIKDMVYILKYLSKIIKLNDVQMKNADCLYDGEVNLADASVLLNFVSEKIDKIPIEKSN